MTGAGVQNADGTVLMPGIQNINPQLGTAWQTTFPAWAGVAFGGGGYFEVTLSFNPGSGETTACWPAFWMDPIELVAPNAITASTQWPTASIPVWNSGTAYVTNNVVNNSSGDGKIYTCITGNTNSQPPNANWDAGCLPSAYGHSVEPDIMEYNAGVGNQGKYGIAAHDWYGAAALGYKKVEGNTGSPANPGVNFALPTKIGLLWVPATASTQGYLKYYCNGVQVGNTVSWNQWSASNGPPAVNPFIDSVMDNYHFPLFLNTGTMYPMTVWSLQVWQPSSANNLVQ